MRYILSLGTNIGERKENIKKAIDILSKEFTITKKSSIYESEPFEIESNKNFYNMCIEIETDLFPLQLLDKIEEIEREMGRKEKGLKKDRIIDIDIILNENNIFLSKRLRIPHPSLYKRKFFLLPLLEIDEEIIEPIKSKKIKDIIKLCDNNCKVWKTGITLE